MYKLHTHCRACGNKVIQAGGIKADKPVSTLAPVLDLGPMPLVNDFRNEHEERAGYAPLKVMYCTRCTLAQLSVVVNPEILYKQYSYVTSDSDTMRKHFETLETDIVKQQGEIGHVLEIGSNNGALLKHLNPRAKAVYGVDPAENLVSLANRDGVPTVAHKWNHFAAAHVLAKMGSVDTVIARHVFCHIDNWREAIDAIDEVCNKKTLVAIEVPWVMDLLDNNQWDTIYHEHLSYMSIGALQFLLKGTNLRLVSVQHYTVHGGTLVLYLRRHDSGVEKDDTVDTFASVEFNRLSEDRWRRLERETMANVDNLRQQVRDYVAQGAMVVGYGASAKSTNWVAACGFTRKDLAFITDTTLKKWYTTSPGSDIPIADPGALLREMPEYAVLFCWNFAAEVLAKEQLWLSKGGKFIIPVPEVRVVGKAEAEGWGK